MLKENLSASFQGRVWCLLWEDFGEPPGPSLGSALLFPSYARRGGSREGYDSCSSLSKGEASSWMPALCPMPDLATSPEARLWLLKLQPSPSSPTHPHVAYPAPFPLVTQP